MQKIQLADIGEISILVDESAATRWNLLLAHGAGAGMEHSFMSLLSKALVQREFRVIRFNFPYRERGKKMPGSPREAVLCWQRMIAYVRERYLGQDLFISGKSYGGRMASHCIADHEHNDVKGLIYYGFPLHAPGKPSEKRAAHLPQVQIPQLFLQGTKDNLAAITLIQKVTGSLENASLIVLEDADHSFKVPKAVGISPEEMIIKLAQETTSWAEKISK